MYPYSNFGEHTRCELLALYPVYTDFLLIETLRKERCPTFQDNCEK